MDLKQKKERWEEISSNLPKNKIITDNLLIAFNKINSVEYGKGKIVCSVSGGSDSDDMMDICFKCDYDKKIVYVWFDTGLEYEATKKHLKYLEEKYNVEIKRVKAKKPIPLSCKECGQPFISKYASEMIERLQRHGFRWENESIDVLLEKYKDCKIALNWWCNCSGEGSMYNINYNKYLKEFMISNPPKFKISNRCCKYAKKDVIHDLIDKEGYELNIYGVRKAEGGARSTEYKSCFDQKDWYDNYRPLFWYTDRDKKQYEEVAGIEHSDCYTKYGLKRTGCAGCPFGRNFEEELKVIEKYEPKLYKAVNHIFKDSYAYTRAYRKFYEEMKEKERKRDLKEKRKWYNKIEGVVDSLIFKQ